MTGTTVHLGQSAIQAHWADALHAGAIVLAFMVGSIIGRSMIEYGARSGFQRIASATLLLEGALIASVVVGVKREGPLLVWPVMLASAMGLQTATLTRVGPLTVHTTFVTGMLNKLAQLVSHGLFVSYDRLRGRTTESTPGDLFCQASFIFSVWAMYLAGAALGTWLVWIRNIRALLFALAVIALAIAVDQAIPLSNEEEHEELHQVKTPIG
jgi:uncharacterized membrane protein YoaK (UPF0700 family)